AGTQATGAAQAVDAAGTADAARAVNAEVNRAWRAFEAKNDQATEAAVARALTANEVDRAAPFAAGATGSDDFGGQMGTGLMNAAFDGTADGRTHEARARTGALQAGWDAGRVAFADEWNVDVVASRDEPLGDRARLGESPVQAGTNAAPEEALEDAAGSAAAIADASAPGRAAPRAGRIGDTQLAATALAASLNGYGPQGRSASQEAAGMISQEVVQAVDREDGRRFRTSEELAHEADRVDVDLASANVEFADELTPSWGFAAAETGLDRGRDAAEAARRVRARNAAIGAAGINAVDPAGDVTVPTGGAAEVTTSGAVFDAGDSAYGATRVGRLPGDGDPAVSAAEEAAQIAASNSNIPAAPDPVAAQLIEDAAARNNASAPGAAGGWAKRPSGLTSWRGGEALGAQPPWDGPTSRASFADELAPQPEDAAPDLDVVAQTFGDTAAFINSVWQSGPAATDDLREAGAQNNAFAPYGTPALQQRTGFGTVPGQAGKDDPSGDAPNSAPPTVPPRHAR
ncbi:MAG: hypothetical protein IRZ18_06905, partial [Clostridia bacterium]|nr:hypothetical protein [Clostridia bacterium]